MTRVLAKVTHATAEILVRVAAIGLCAMTVIVGWQVFGRYVLNSSPSWSEQASLTLMIWYVSLSAAAGVREGFHIRIVALENAVSLKAKKTFRVLSSIIVMVCGVAMCVCGTDLVLRTWAHVIPSLGVPRGIAYAGLPIAGALIVLFSIEHIIKEFEAESVKDEEEPKWS